MARFLLGINYWSQKGGPRMWDAFDADFLRAELAHVKRVGVGDVRAFAFIPTFCPAPPEVDRGALERFRSFLGLAGAAGLKVWPTPIVGHMSGANFGFPGQGERSLWSDPTLLAWQKALVGRLVEAGRDSAAVAGWILSNEIPYFAGWGGRDEMINWSAELVAEVRARDGRPVGLGDGATLRFPVRETVGLVDFVGPHVYYADTDPLRQAYRADFIMATVRPLGARVLLEEFGCSFNQAGEAEQAAYFRELIFAALGAGAMGAFPWCWCDFDPEVEGLKVPYSHHAFELGFGVIRKDGSEKPACDELRAARQVIDALGDRPRKATPPRAALLRPRYLDEDFPFSWQDREEMWKTLLQSYVLACQAGLDPVVVREQDDLLPYDLLLAPATQKLTTPTWLALAARAREGKTVYWSYFSGDHAFHQGMWCADFGGLTGLAHRLRYGCFDAPEPLLSLRGALTLDVPTGIAESQKPWSLSRLPVEIAAPDAVEVLATEAGRPALLRRRLGKGRVIFLTHPLERYLANRADGSSLGGHALYRLLADEAGIGTGRAGADPDVLVRRLDLGDETATVVANRSWRDGVDGRVDCGERARVILARDASAEGELGPKGVRVILSPR